MAKSQERRSHLIADRFAKTTSSKRLIGHLAPPESKVVKSNRSLLGFLSHGKQGSSPCGKVFSFRMPTLWFADGHQSVAPVYLYRFDWGTPMLRLLRLDAAHATELPYVWGNLVAGPKDPTFKLGGLAAGTAVSERMRTRWLNFAATTEPSGPAGEPVWRRYRRDDRAALVIDAHDSVVDDLDRNLRMAWGSEVLNFR